MSISKVRSRSSGEAKREGFWRSPEEPGLPRPVANEQPWEGQLKFLTRLNKLQSKAEGIAYKGWSTCRVCQCRNGSVTFKYKGWSWPSGFIHYIEKHNVQPTDAFQKFVNSFFTAAADPAGVIDQKMRSKPGTIRERSVYTAVLEKMKLAESSSDWLSLLCDLFDIPQYSVFHVSDPKLPGKWKVDASSKMRLLTLTRRPSGDIAKTMSKTVREDLQATFYEFEKGQYQALVYSTAYPESTDTSHIRRLVMTMENIVTGGGYDENPSYALALCIRPVFADYAELSGQRAEKGVE